MKDTPMFITTFAQCKIYDSDSGRIFPAYVSDIDEIMEKVKITADDGKVSLTCNYNLANSKFKLNPIPLFYS